jgi:phosphohistidine phosphatase
LNHRGRKAAVLLGNKIKKLEMQPDRILCSTATRAVQTLQGIMQILSQYGQTRIPEVLYFEELYLATPTAIARVVAEQHGESRKLMCIGHNPGIESLASQLAKEAISMHTAHWIAFETKSIWGNASEFTKDWKMVLNVRGEDD